MITDVDGVRVGHWTDPVARGRTLGRLTRPARLVLGDIAGDHEHLLRAVAVNERQRAKRTALYEMARIYEPGDGPLPVSVPGCVDGWIELHKKFGKLPLSHETP